MHPLCRNRDRPKVHEVGPLIVAYYQLPDNAVGGDCHVVLDDSNIEDIFIEGDLANCKKNKNELGAQIMGMMLQMTKTQRLKVLRYVDVGREKRWS